MVLAKRLPFVAGKWEIYDKKQEEFEHPKEIKSKYRSKKETKKPEEPYYDRLSAEHENFLNCFWANPVCNESMKENVLE